MNSSDDHRDRTVTVEPLTRKNRQGETYDRHSGVERQIAGALPLSGSALRERLAVLDRESPEYLQEETLVYLLRHWRRHGDEQRVSDISVVLLRRLTPIVHKRLSSLGPQSLEEAHSEVVSRLFQPIFDLTTDKADFFQVRFWVVVERLCIQAFGRQLAALKREKNQLPFSHLSGDPHDIDVGPETGESRRHRLTAADKERLSTPPPGDATATADRQREAQRVVLTVLEEPLRSAYLLRHYHDWPIEHQDPTVRTISQHFGKTPRTIRNWLTKAEQKLATWREAQR